MNIKHSSAWWRWLTLLALVGAVLAGCGGGEAAAPGGEPADRKSVV